MKNIWKVCFYSSFAFALFILGACSKDKKTEGNANSEKRDPLEQELPNARDLDFSYNPPPVIPEVQLTPKVENWINQNYSEPKKKRAALQTARAFQVILDYPQEIVAADYAINRSVVCRGKIMSSAETRALSGNLKKLTYDTPRKIKAYARFNASMSGGVYTLVEGTEEEVCD